MIATSQNARTITAREAAIATASIEVQALRIGRRQMTLTVFRQLLIADPFDNDNNMIGESWGYVHYSMPMPIPTPQYERKRTRDVDIHVVFEYNGRLYRYPVFDYDARSNFLKTLTQLFIAV